MSLPKLNVPVYEAILPSTETVIKYRPFLVKEEKILLTAMESEDEKSISIAIKQIINNCVQGTLDVERLPTFDIEYLFLRLRAKSVGEEVKIGKRTGKDSEHGKLTYPLVMGLQASEQLARDKVDSAISALQVFGPAADPLVLFANFVVNRTR